MARGRSGPVVSLFAFQDIITSVTAILIVVALMMALELVEQPQAEAASPAAHAKATIAALETAEAERDEIKDLLADESEAVREAAGTSAAELRRDITALEDEAERVNAQIVAGRKQAEALAEAASAVEVRRFDAAETVEELESVRRRVEELEAEVEESKTDDRVVFTLPKGFNKPGWLVVLAGDSITAAPLGAKARPISFGADESAFLDWAGDRRGDYFLLLVRPSGVDAFDAVDTDFRARGFTYGYDVIGADTKVLHPERGAAP